MKTKPIANTEIRQDDSLPSREQLAMIAASTPRKNPADAVRHALDVWREAGKVLANERIAMTQRPFAGIPLPPKFPATLRDFLRLAINTRTPADSMKRLRDYLRERNRIYLLAEKLESQEAATQGHAGTKKIARPTLEPDDEEQVERRAAVEIESMQNHGLTQMGWRRLALSYHTWWREKKSNQARISAKKRCQLT